MAVEFHNVRRYSHSRDSFIQERVGAGHLGRPDGSGNAERRPAGRTTYITYAARRAERPGSEGAARQPSGGA